MGYGPLTASQAQAQPVQLFKFQYGPDPEQYYGYTDHVEGITLEDGTVYVPVPIERGNIDANGTLDRSGLKINTDIGTQIAEIFRVYPPAQVVTLIIREGHVDDPDEEFLVTWAGRIVGCHREGSEAVLSGEPVSTMLRRPGLRRHYQYGCPLALYSQGPGLCNADKASKTVSATVSAVAGATVTLDSGWEGAFAAAKFLGGYLEWNNPDGLIDRRTIIRITGDVLSLSGVIIGLAASDSVNVVLGCNHKPFAADGGDCEGLHDNIVNYGGQPWIPLKNPIGTFNNYF